MDNYEDDTGYKTPQHLLELAAFVIDKTDTWRDHRRANFETDWDEYERMWRGQWSGSDKNRQSERSRMVTPAIQHAIDSRRTEIEEAIFGQNLWFDIDDDDQNPQDVAQLKAALMVDFKRDRVKKIISQVNTNAEVYGTGIAEIVISEEPMLQPASAPTPVQGMKAVGVTENTRKSVKPYPVHPRNFLIDPNARDVEDSLGCAVEEYVPLFRLVERMEDGTYRKCPINESVFETDKEPVTEDAPFTKDKALVIRYYGLVPAEYLKGGDEEYEESEEAESLYGEFDDYANMVEAVVIICNGHVLMAKENPYMMKDRPIVVYRPEIIPGRFWGRGTCEKGYNSQKAIDAQIRAHLDYSAITAAPMIASDVTRMPRGFKFEITPGRNIGVQGPPQEILMPITLGQTSPINVETARLFEKYLAQSTGTTDPANNVNAQDPAVMSMQMAGLLKKHKHSLMNFQEDFLIPLVQKTSWRYMQFDPDRYPVQDFSFVPTGTLGMMAREYEQQQLAGILKTLGPQSPIVPMLLSSIVENSNIASKEQLIQALREMSQQKPDPMAEQMHQLQMQAAQAQLQKVQAEAQKAAAEAQLAMAKAQALPMEVQAKMAGSLSQNMDQDSEFDRRLRLMQEQSKRMDLNIKAQEMQSNERIAQMQMQGKAKSDQQRMMVDLVKARQSAMGKKA